MVKQYPITIGLDGTADLVIPLPLNNTKLAYQGVVLIDHSFIVATNLIVR